MTKKSSDEGSSFRKRCKVSIQFELEYTEAEIRKEEEEEKKRRRESYIQTLSIALCSCDGASKAL